jgi:hypothetical protein
VDMPSRYSNCPRARIPSTRSSTTSSKMHHSYLFFRLTFSIFIVVFDIF